MRLPELFVLILLAVALFGLVLLVRAVLRPAAELRYGSKALWVILLAVTNPFLTRHLGALISVLSLPVFVAVVVLYAVLRRKEAVPARPLPPNGERPG